MADWIKIKNEYINTNISYRKIAEKYKVSFNTLRDRAKRESWYELKQKQHDIITTRTAQKIADVTVQKEVDRNTKHLEAYDLALDACVRILKKELKKGVDMFGNEYASPVTIHSKLARVVESLEKIQKGQRLAEGLDVETVGGDDREINIIITPAGAGEKDAD